MVYGGAELLGVPWETIIKVYRQKAAAQRFEQLEEYAQSFLAFLSENDAMFPPDAQRTHVGRGTAIYLRRVKDAIDSKIRDLPGQVTDEQIQTIAADTVAYHLAEWEGASLLNGLEASDIATAIERYKTVVDEAIEAVFEAMPRTELLVQQLHALSANLFARNRNFVPTSGVVIAGFGESDFVPALYEYQVNGVVLSRLRYVAKRTATASNGASITPFAQSEMVHTFMQGINPNFRQVVGTYLTKVLGKLPDKLLESLEPQLAGADEATRTDLQNTLKATCGTITQLLQELVAAYAKEKHTDPVMLAVSALPKDQLAEMAESLVNLTSFQQKVSGVTETVGGPIDVAVISKGDGFVWIKRKHYFQPGLNQHFFANYYRPSDAESPPSVVPANQDVPRV